MVERGPGLSDSRVLALVRAHWSRDVDAVEPWGVGSQPHWRATSRGRPQLFVTHHRPAGASLEAALAATADLAFALDFVIAGLPTDQLRWTLPVAGGAISVAPWVHGETATPDAGDTTRLLARLHTAHPPSKLPRWRPLEEADLGERARGPAVRRELAAYRRLAEVAVLSEDDRPWVVTHGDLCGDNLVHTPVRTLLVGWEEVRLAPRERDRHPDGTPPDPRLAELFALERRLARHLPDPRR